MGKLAFGEWVIDVYAKNAAGIVTGHGFAAVMIHVGQTVSVNVVVKPLTGTGSLNLTVSWNPGSVENPSIASELIPPFGVTQLLDFTLETGTAVYSNHALLTGYYSLTVKLLDSGILTMGAVEVVRVVKDGTTNGEFNFCTVNHPGGEQGFCPSTPVFMGNTCIFAVDEGGNVLWERWIGGTGDDACMDSKITENGDLVGVGSTTSYHAAYSDFWIFKADSSAVIPNSPYNWGNSSQVFSDLSLTNQLSGLSSVGSFHLTASNALFPVTVIEYTVRDVTF